MKTGPDHNTTENDEFIARALAEEEQARAAAETQQRHRQQPQQSQRTFQYPGDRLRQQHQQQPYPGQQQSSLHHQPYAAQHANSGSNPTPQKLPSLGFGGGAMRKRTPMCHIPCVVGPNAVCVEMMVDTGAESSVISESLAKELGLHQHIDRRAQGIAAGVGQARIVGEIHNAVVTLGQVEFLMDFMVLQVPQRLMLLGLDQMRKYKCIVNLEKDVLVFGGSGGVEVPMLPPDQQRHLMVPGIGGGCTIS